MMFNTARFDDAAISTFRARPSRQCQHLRVFACGGQIYAQGDKADTLFKLVTGAVRLCRVTSDGRRQVVGFYFAGETFGFESDSTRSFFAEALVNSCVETLPGTTGNGDAADLMLKAIESMVRAQKHLLVVGRQSAEERVAAFLLDMAERQGKRTLIDLPMSRTDMADYLGMTIETASRTLSALKRRGFVRLPAKRQIEICGLGKLRELTGC
jgi:CRP/FNR family nitrogen fixation transcriptional regulator